MAHDTRFIGSIPDFYDRCLAPSFIEPYARDLASRTRAKAGDRVLELACGTGRLTRHLVAAFPADVALDATDLNDGMIAIARQRVTAPNVRWSTADASSLPFEAGTFAEAFCEFGVMLFADKAAAARQVRRALAPGGSYWLNTWCAIAENPVSRVGAEAVARFLGGSAPPFYHVPFGYFDPHRIEADLRAGGFAVVEVEKVELEGAGASAQDIAMGLVHGTPMANELRERGLATADEVTAAVADAIAREFGGAAVRAPMSALVAHAR